MVRNSWVKEPFTVNREPRLSHQPSAIINDSCSKIEIYMKSLILTFLLLLSTVSLSAQWRSTKLSEEEKRAEYREKIGIDMSVPDFETKKIDAKVMGPHLANIRTFMMKNYQQGL